MCHQIGNTVYKWRWNPCKLMLLTSPPLAFHKNWEWHGQTNMLLQLQTISTNTFVLRKLRKLERNTLQQREGNLLLQAPEPWFVRFNNPATCIRAFSAGNGVPAGEQKCVMKTYCELRVNGDVAERTAITLAGNSFFRSEVRSRNQTWKTSSYQIKSTQRHQPLWDHFWQEAVKCVFPLHAHLVSLSFLRTNLPFCGSAAKNIQAWLRHLWAQVALDTIRKAATISQSETKPIKIGNKCHIQRQRTSKHWSEEAGKTKLWDVFIIYQKNYQQ